MEFPFNRQELTVKMAVWIRQNWHCSVVLTELNRYRFRYAGAVPDILAFKRDGYSFSVKIVMDKESMPKSSIKVCRLGDSHYYAVPITLHPFEPSIKGSGLIYINHKLQARIIYLSYMLNESKQDYDKRKKREMKYLLACLSDIQNCGQAIFMKEQLLEIKKRHAL